MNNEQETRNNKHERQYDDNDEQWTMTKTNSPSTIFLSSKFFMVL
jgi:hypothetical protein